MDEELDIIFDPEEPAYFQMDTRFIPALGAMSFLLGTAFLIYGLDGII